MVSVEKFHSVLLVLFCKISQVFLLLLIWQRFVMQWSKWVATQRRSIHKFLLIWSSTILFKSTFQAPTLRHCNSISISSTIETWNVTHF